MIFDSFSDPVSQPLPKDYHSPSLSSSQEVRNVTQHIWQGIGPGVLLVGVQALGHRRNAFRILRLKRSLNLSSSSSPQLTRPPFTHPVRQGVQQVLDEASTTKNPENFFQNNSPLTQSLKHEVAQISAHQRASRIQAITNIRLFTKNYETAGLILFGFIAAILMKVQNKDQAKTHDLTQKIQEVSQNLAQEAQNLQSPLEQKTTQKEQVVKDIDDLILQLPENEQKLFLEAEQILIQKFSQNFEQIEQQLVAVIQSLNETQPIASSGSIVLAKEVGSNLAYAFIGISLALLFNRTAVVKSLTKEIIRLGVPEKVINKVLMGMVTVGCQEALLAATDQNVTKQQIQTSTQKILKELDLDQDPTPLSTSQEEQLNQNLANVGLITMSKFLACMVDNELLSDMTEVIFNYSFKIAANSQVDQYVAKDELTSEVQKGLAPVHHKVQLIEKSINQLEDKDLTGLQNLKQKAQDKLDEVQASQKQAQALDYLGWIGRQVSYLRFW